MHATIYLIANCLISGSENATTIDPNHEGAQLTISSTERVYNSSMPYQSQFHLILSKH